MATIISISLNSKRIFKKNVEEIVANKIAELQARVDFRKNMVQLTDVIETALEQQIVAREMNMKQWLDLEVSQQIREMEIKFNRKLEEKTAAIESELKERGETLALVVEACNQCLDRTLKLEKIVSQLDDKVNKLDDKVNKLDDKVNKLADNMQQMNVRLDQMLGLMQKQAVTPSKTSAEKEDNSKNFAGLKKGFFN